MKIYDIELDSLDRYEYLFLLKSLCNYYSCLFGYTLNLEEVK